MKEKQLIVDYCTELGLDTVGFTECRVFHELKGLYEERKRINIENEFEEKDIDNRINPFVYMSEGKTIISIAFPYLHGFSKEEGIYFSKYTKGRDYHKVLGEYLDKICTFIQGLGGKALYFVDNNALPERYIAYLSNVGFIGKNNMLITKKYGSYVFLGEIITDLELLSSEEKINIFEKKVYRVDKYEECENCNQCLKECPTKAINIKKKDANICLSYITQKKEIEDKWFPLIGGRLFGCDSCQDCCPYNKNIMFSKIEDFRPRSNMDKPDLEEVTNLSNSIFREKYSLTSCGWRGKNVLMRNALIAGSNLKKNINICEIKSSYVKGYYDRLFFHKEL